MDCGTAEELPQVLNFTHLRPESRRRTPPGGVGGVDRGSAGSRRLLELAAVVIAFTTRRLKVERQILHVET